MRKYNTSGVVGVSWHKKSNKWAAYITLNRTFKYLGTYEDIDAAVAARAEAEECVRIRERR